MSSTAYQRLYRKRRYVNRGHLLQDATGSRRRLQALAALGFSDAELLPFGLNTEAVRGIRQGATELVQPRIRAAIKRAFDELPYGQPTSSSARRLQTRAKNMGWLPAAAWDDIDNDEAPYDGTLDAISLGVTKNCTRCNQVKLVSEFYRVAMRGGDKRKRLDSRCITCKREVARLQWRSRGRD